MPTDGSNESSDRAGVVRTVTNDAWRWVNQFHASGEVGLGQFLEHALLVALEFALAKFINNRNGQACVDRLESRRSGLESR